MALNVQCKKCANLRNDWCKLVVDSPDPDMVRDCKYYRGNTNADKYFRNATDEKLAKWLRGFAEEIAKQSCEVYTMDADFEKDTLDWLKQEVESDA